MFPTKDQRVALCATRVTLNGAPARITGHARDFARVTDSGTGLSCEWAWETVAAIVAKGGKFRT